MKQSKKQMVESISNIPDSELVKKELEKHMKREGKYDKYFHVSVDEYYDKEWKEHSDKFVVKFDIRYYNDVLDIPSWAEKIIIDSSYIDTVYIIFVGDRKKFWDNVKSA